MINYYKILDIKKDMTHQQLNKLISDDIKLFESKKNELNTVDKIKAEMLISAYKKFYRTIKHYGSKENYDRALEKSAKKVKVNVSTNAKIKKVILITATIGTLATGIGKYATEYKIVHIPDIEYVNVEDSLETFGIDAKFIGACRNKDNTDLYRIKRDDAKKLNDFIEEKTAIYNFKYIVKSGDSYSKLKEKFEALNITKIESIFDSKELYTEDVLSINTHNKEIANKMKKVYEDEIKRKKEQEIKDKTPISFDTYVIKPGDTLVEIAESFGVTCNDIIMYNDNVNDIYNIRAGDTIRIPYGIYHKPIKK